MKTHRQLLLLLALVLLIKPSAAQMLIMDGIVTNEKGHLIQGYYELRNSKKQLLVNMGRKLKVRLPRNDTYTLTFSKPGYQSKSIIISTFNASNWSYVFLFEVTLRRMKVTENMATDIVAGSVYYDPFEYDYTSSVSAGESSLARGGSLSDTHGNN